MRSLIQLLLFASLISLVVKAAPAALKRTRGEVSVNTHCFPRTLYFSAKKHIAVILKVEVLVKKALFPLSSIQPIKYTN